ncbi:MAG: fructose-6-phosphate aldolase [Elusimicrobia bacterium]|nr:fructose-6-phosphate aldolase [Elusimicrobiota bacterium]
MKLFVDSANPEYIRKVNEWGLLGGVTTNPTLIAKHFEEHVLAGQKSGGEQTQIEVQKRILKEICGIAPVDVLAEPLSSDYKSIMDEAMQLVKISPQHVVAKIAMTADGVRAVSELSGKNIKTALTLIFSLEQALVAAVAGADYICPFVGRLDDTGVNGMDLIRDIVTIYKNYGFKTKVVVASVRNTEHIIKSAIYGADAVTVPFKIIEGLFKHPLTDVGIKKFLEDWAKVSK